MASEFTDLYKQRLSHDKLHRQSERRLELLEKHRSQRNGLVDSNRSIQPLKKIFRQSHRSKKSNLYKNQIQLSEWMQERPEDIENWLLKPCPKGKRYLVVASDGKTLVLNKNGSFVKKIRSILPGDYRSSCESITILDCIFVPTSNEFFVLDALAYGNQDLVNCEADFRFYWIASRIQEDGLGKITAQNQFAFRTIEHCNCSDEFAFNEFVSKYPLWPNNEPELDGFLFYHKESSYVHGKTPLVLWLFAFMLPEVFNVPSLNERYLDEKPNNYTNYRTFIKEFDETQKAKRRKNNQNRIERMEAEVINGSEPNSAEAVMESARDLECEEIDDELNSSNGSHTMGF